ncbi:IS110 family transposase [Pseudomonadota bacterium]
MNDHSENTDIEVVAIDLAKKSFQLHGVDANGHKVMGKKLTRNKLKLFMVQLPPCLVVMESCIGAHYWGRLFQSYGHEVKLIAPQFVKPFVKSNKNDAADAEAIYEASQRPGMRFVAIKSVEQLDMQAIHRVRSQLVKTRTAAVNQIRGLLLEHGIDIPKGRAQVLRKLPGILEDAENGLSGRFRSVLHDLQEELRHIDQRIQRYDTQIEQIVRDSDQARLLLGIPGIGPQTATALLSSIGDVGQFKNGRELAAFLGLVPRQHSTGGRPTLLGISKRGDVYLRTLLIHGARAVLRYVDNKPDHTSRWAKELMQRRGMNIAAVAMANKMARTVHALLSKGERYDINHLAIKSA